MDSWLPEQQKAAAGQPEGPRPYTEFVPLKSSGRKFAPVEGSNFDSKVRYEDIQRAAIVAVPAAT